MKSEMPRSFPIASKTLVIQPLPGIGDMLWHLPLLKAIARQTPSKKITLLCKPSSQAPLLFKESEFIDDILFLPSPSTSSFWEAVTHLKRLSFHQSWVLHHSKRYYMLAFFANIQKRYGYGFRWQRMWLTEGKTLTSDQRSLSTLDRIAAYMDTQDFKKMPQDPFLKISKKQQTSFLQKFSRHPRPWIVLGIGATQAFKSWSEESFAALAQELSQQEGKTVFLCGSSSEQERAQAILGHLKTPKTSIVPITDFSLDEVMTLLSLASLFIGNDSGLMNIAATLGIPTVGLFGATPQLSYVPNLFGVMPPPPLASMDAITPSMVLSVLSEKGFLDV